MRLRMIAKALLASALVVGSSLALTGAPAQAAGCRVSPYSATVNRTVSYYDPSATWSAYDFLPSAGGYYTTTSQCSDIQIKSTNGESFTACVIFLKYGNECNYFTEVPAGSWTNIATAVLDGTRFRVFVAQQYSYPRPFQLSAYLEF